LVAFVVLVMVLIKQLMMLLGMLFMKLCAIVDDIGGWVVILVLLVLLPLLSSVVSMLNHIQHHPNNNGSIFSNLNPCTLEL